MVIYLPLLMVFFFLYLLKYINRIFLILRAKQKDQEIHFLRWQICQVSSLSKRCVLAFLI